MKSYIYLITCLVNGKQYVGKTNDPEMRRWDHFYRSRNNKQKQVIHRAIAKYGEENFTFEVILECESETAAFEAEHSIILEKREAGIELYNMNDGGFGGFNPTKETRERMSKARMGMKFSDETNEKISNVVKKYWAELPEDARRMRGDKLQKSGQIWRQNLSVEEKEAWRERVRLGNMGKVISEEHKMKISETLKKKHEGKPRAHEQVEEYVVNCIHCNVEMVRKKPKTFSPQSKTPSCTSCGAKHAWETRRISQNIEPRYDNTSCTTCQKEIPPKNIRVSEERNCTTCGRKKMWARRRAMSNAPSHSSLPSSEQS
jgi:group I intron endonuclease